MSRKSVLDKKNYDFDFDCLPEIPLYALLPRKKRTKKPDKFTYDDITCHPIYNCQFPLTARYYTENELKEKEIQAKFAGQSCSLSESITDFTRKSTSSARTSKNQYATDSTASSVQKNMLRTQQSQQIPYRTSLISQQQIMNEQMPPITMSQQLPSYPSISISQQYPCPPDEPPGKETLTAECCLPPPPPCPDPPVMDCGCAPEVVNEPVQDCGCAPEVVNEPVQDCGCAPEVVNEPVQDCGCAPEVINEPVQDCGCAPAANTAKPLCEESCCATNRMSSITSSITRQPSQGTSSKSFANRSFVRNGDLNGKKNSLAYRSSGLQPFSFPAVNNQKLNEPVQNCGCAPEVIDEPVQDCGCAPEVIDEPVQDCGCAPEVIDEPLEDCGCAPAVNTSKPMCEQSCCAASRMSSLTSSITRQPSQGPNSKSLANRSFLRNGDLNGKKNSLAYRSSGLQPFSFPAVNEPVQDCGCVPEVIDEPVQDCGCAPEVIDEPLEDCGCAPAVDTSKPMCEQSRCAASRMSSLTSSITRQPSQGPTSKSLVNRSFVRNGDLNGKKNSLAYRSSGLQPLSFQAVNNQEQTEPVQDGGCTPEIISEPVQDFGCAPVVNTSKPLCEQSCSAANRMSSKTSSMTRQPSQGPSSSLANRSFARNGDFNGKNKSLAYRSSGLQPLSFPSVNNQKQNEPGQDCGCTPKIISEPVQDCRCAPEIINEPVQDCGCSPEIINEPVQDCGCAPEIINEPVQDCGCAPEIINEPVQDCGCAPEIIDEPVPDCGCAPAVNTSKSLCQESCCTANRMLTSSMTRQPSQEPSSKSSANRSFVRNGDYNGKKNSLAYGSSGLQPPSFSAVTNQKQNTSMSLQKKPLNFSGTSTSGKRNSSVINPKTNSLPLKSPNLFAPPNMHTSQQMSRMKKSENQFQPTATFSLPGRLQQQNENNSYYNGGELCRVCGGIKNEYENVNANELEDFNADRYEPINSNENTGNGGYNTEEFYDLCENGDGYESAANPYLNNGNGCCSSGNMCPSCGN